MPFVYALLFTLVLTSPAIVAIELGPMFAPLFGDDSQEQKDRLRRTWRLLYRCWILWFVVVLALLEFRWITFVAWLLTIPALVAIFAYMYAGRNVTAPRS